MKATKCQNPKVGLSQHGPQISKWTKSKRDNSFWDTLWKTNY